MAQDWKRLGTYLKTKRVECGYSQEFVAKKLRYTSPQFISNWERGVSSPPLDKINYLISIYGLSRKEVIKIILDETKNHLERKIRNEERLSTTTSGNHVR